MIVVGVDGSDGAKRALAWALGEARVRNTPLRVVNAYQSPVAVYAAAGFGMPVADVDDQALQEASRTSIGAALDEQADAARDLEIERVAVNGQAASVLVDASSGAELLVVGSRGHGGFAGLLLGSVGMQCVHHAHCPVVVIPKDASA